MRTSIKQLWKGMIPVRDVIVNRALKENEDLIVEVGREAYIIKIDQLKNPRMAVPIRDNFSDKMQKLLYYGITKAAEDDKQQTLFSS